ncbi:ATP-binding cassette domain-containing protein [Porphyromonas levii]|uniref:ABC transporter ATP-binding protein n=1 Tax=Porphyromonas levii TaxID=28114 RepID=A0A4Y8WQP3_9PORP|nr:ABC transporter ATP-binding protein [Porphyromonas levii]MBR8704152.1 Vitamin B12 import ATP-binding protein BtuD [Porphyromonas levii]MBR8712435.1 Vitamin B12 import ATP-binding protein BtuD [Porphyromonas levii]MBR8714393.1 Vitamin B12 import ATP-binding protein BtuD [Porphyromonas levii]MBR8726934.1 Vitamin B12 import ATP-binding protein BtuD [Porphyromonas levii]MBR8728903.1 Vitamin B12 import ATP-binding protein BtuD [Porphyromonas levii]
MIEIKDLEYKYSIARSLFQGISLSIESGHISGLLGKNGEGKTTLLKLIAGQLLRKGGTLSVAGEDPTKRQVSFLSDVYYLPETVNVPKGVTIRKYFDALSPFYPNYSKEMADQALEAFNLNYKMKITKLSQGQQKKAMIAFALSLGTRILLLDEPTNGLDIPSKSALRRLLAKQITGDRYVIISTHQVRDLEQIIDHVIVMDKNKIILSKSIGEITDQFTFRPVVTSDTPVYCEQTISGKMGIFAKEEGDESDAYSTELFFNALMTNQEDILKHLNK